jgi:hypothetical protein
MEFGRVHNLTYFPVTTVHKKSGQKTPLRILMLVIFEDYNLLHRD